jgi:hypothetical protein
MELIYETGLSGDVSQNKVDYFLIYNGDGLQ